jgi:hypothetical protein
LDRSDYLKKIPDRSEGGGELTRAMKANKRTREQAKKGLHNEKKKSNAHAA